MKIVNTQVMKGPSTWSPLHSQLIVLTLDTEGSDHLVQADREALFLRLQKFIPSLDPSATLPESFSTLLLELLVLSASPATYSRIDVTGDKQFRFIYSYTSEEAALFAADAAVEIITGAAENRPTDLSLIVQEITRLSKKYELGATSAYILGEAKKRGIPFRRFQHTSLFTLGHGNKQRLIRTAVTDSTSGLGIEVAGDKDETKQLLASANVPVPKGLLVYSEEELTEALSLIKYPLVTKPLDGNQGRGVTTHIYNPEQALFGYNIAKKISDTIIIEEFVEGDDYRFLVINYNLIAVTRRTPAMVTGDGRSTVQQLIDVTNQDPNRGHGSEHVLAPIKIDKVTEKVLRDKNYTLQTVLKDQEILYLKETANISAGGTATDVTDEVHPFTVFMVERIARLFKLNVCGIDIMMKNIGQPLVRDNGAIIEVNAGPGIRMHTNPQIGTPRNVAAPIIDMLFPETDGWKIPVMAVSGHSKLTDLIASLAAAAGYKPGSASNDTLRVMGHKIEPAQPGQKFNGTDLLFDPMIDLAILDCNSADIQERGLDFESCDLSILTALEGLDKIATKAALEMRLLLAKRTALQGHVLLPADDETVSAVGADIPAHIVLVGKSPGNDQLKKHVSEGGIAGLYTAGEMIIYDQQKRLTVPLPQVLQLAGAGLEYEAQEMAMAVMAAYVSRFKLPIFNW